jgi:hypothetical protein
MSISIVIARRTFQVCANYLRYYRTIRLDERNGIAKRTPEYIQKKMESKDAVIPRQWQSRWFCYIESWQESNYVAHSGLIVHPITEI